MKKSLLFVLALFVMFSASCFADFYNPWQMITKGSTGTLAPTAVDSQVAVTFEANSGQNIIIDNITCSAKTTTAEVWVMKKARLATMANSSMFATVESTVVILPLICDSIIIPGATGTGESITIGSRNPEIPLWVADSGDAVVLRLVGGGGVGNLLVSGRRGSMPLSKPSAAKGY